MTANQTTTHTVTVRMALDEAQVQALDAAVTALTALVDTMRPDGDEDAPARPAAAPESDAQTEDAEDPETESGPENGAQGRIGWLRRRPDDENRDLMREVPGGWTCTDNDYLSWSTEDLPDPEFTPIRTLADDEVAVKRGVVDMVVKWLGHARADARRDGRSVTANGLHRAIDALTAVLEAGEDRG